MFVMIVEKRISATVVKRGELTEDWYVLVAIALPFKPSVGFEVELKGSASVKLLRVVYNPNNGTFWAQVKPVLHPRPNAREAAQGLVNVGGWDIAMEESTLTEAIETLRNKAVRELHSMLLKAQSRIAVAGAPPIDLHFHTPGRKKS